jgi:YVTN family beta-propeller protein
VGTYEILPGVSTGAVPATAVPVGNNPLAVAFDAANGDVYVANQNVSGAHGSVTVISGATDAVLSTLTVGGRPDVLAVDANNGDIYVLNSATRNASVIDGSNNSLVATVSLPCYELVSLVLDPVNHDLYAGCDTGPGVVYVVSDASNTVSTTLQAAAGWSSAVDTTDGDVYTVGNVTQSENVSEIDGGNNTIVKTIDIGARVNEPGMAFDPVNGGVYISNGELLSGNVTVVSSVESKVVASVPEGEEPLAIAFDPVNDDVYVANRESSNVSVISGSTNTTVATVTVGSDPASLFIDPISGNVYVVNSGSDNVSLISGSTNTVIATLDVGSDPRGVAVDPTSGQVFVTNNGSANVSVISTQGGGGGHTPHQGGLLGLSSVDLGLLLGGATVVMAAAVAVIVRMRTRAH